MRNPFNYSLVESVSAKVVLTDTTDWVEIDSGNGDKFSHAQGNYLEKGLMNENGKYNYKFDNELVELTDEEKELFFPTPIPEPTEMEKLDARLTYLEIMSEVA